MKKASNRKINQDFLNHRVSVVLQKGFQKQKWVEFCEYFLALGYDIYLYEARRTLSKYVTVKRPDDHSRSFKVRFSNHAPIKYREQAGDCDFFVGKTNFQVTTTGDAIKATLKFFEEQK